MKTANGIYTVIKIGSSFFPVFKYNDGEALFLGKAYATEKGAKKRLDNHTACINKDSIIN